MDGIDGGDARECVQKILRSFDHCSPTWLDHHSAAVALVRSRVLNTPQFATSYCLYQTTYGDGKQPAVDG